MVSWIGLIENSLALSLEINSLLRTNQSMLVCAQTATPSIVSSWQPSQWQLADSMI
jgi:hypothetical protein